jgi:lysozyme family protein
MTNLSGYVATGGILDVFNTAVATAAPQYAIVGGIAKPTTAGTLELFKELQRQVNRVAKAKGFPAIGTDGDIGPGTVAAVQAVQSAAKAELTAGVLADTRAATGVALIRSSTADGIASNGLNAGYIKGYADQLGVSSSVASPKPATPPAIYNPATGTSTPQSTTASALDAWRALGSTSQMAVAGVGGLLAFMLLTRKKRKKGRR